MLPRHELPPPAPSKVSGLLSIMLGILWLFVAGFVVVVPGAFFGIPQIARIGFGVVVGIFGAYRVFSGISTIHKADEAERALRLNGKSKQL